MSKVLGNKYMKNSDLNVDDFDWALEIYGEAPEILAGKMNAPSMIKNDNSQVLKHELNDLKSRRVKLYIDIFYVNGLVFLHTKSKKIDYITIQTLTSKKGTEIRKKLK